MVLESLGEALKGAIRKIARASYVDKDLVKEVVRDLQRALIRADVNVNLVFRLTKEVERRALEEKPPPGMNAREHVIRIIYEEIVKVLGRGRTLEIKPQRILFVGLYGQGKTTTIGKVAKYFQKRGLKVALIAGDTHRPAAYDQILQIGQQLSVPVYGRRGEIKAPKIVREGLIELKDYDVILIDSAGRHSLEKELIEEIKRMARVARPDEIVLVLDATMGQQAGEQAKAFHDAVGITGVILTKMDGSAKGGGALSAVAETGAPILFIGTGEHLDDLEVFDPTRFVSRLLGMGDLQSLLEKAEEAMSEVDMEKTVKHIMSGKFTLKDMYNQMEALTRMGPLSKIFSMLPMGMQRLSKEEIESMREKLRKFKVIMDSMTEEELENPRIIKHSRIIRIARGSGTTPSDVRELLKQYKTSRRAIKGVLSNRKLRRQLMRHLKEGGLDFGTM
ncbi:MAG: signal recognition particle protein [Thermoplasmata archaeon]|nr:MAG: signal recognition particle protein [Thermoplasmata archaeon]